MKLPLYQVDAFAARPFSGNPAAVCPLSAWLSDATLQQIAAENNLSETAFLTGGDGRYELRWFTPAIEVDLCGHATLASAYVVFTKIEPGRRDVEFHSKSGPLRVTSEQGMLWLDFPSRPPSRVEAPADAEQALGRRPVESLAARDYMFVFEDEADVRSLAPDLGALARWDRKVIVTAGGGSCDFVSRFFAPTAGVPEDPVTGSAHCTLTPYWAKRLGKTRLSARQVSSRGGDLVCEDRGDRVRIGGNVVPYLEGTIEVP